MKTKIILSLILILLTSLCFAEYSKELAEFDKDFCIITAKENKTTEDWIQYNKRPPYSKNEEITGDYNKDLAVKCSNGTFVGKNYNHISTWQGIPYAEQPLGELRWRAAQAPKKSHKIFEAYNYGPISYQNTSSPMASHAKMGEDCLNLNIWSNSKNTNKNKPVLFWIHGGGFCYGSGSDYNCYELLNSNPEILVVTINYRLGIMGINNFKNLKGGNNAPLQCGLTDQIQGLKWVKENISAFGGDPNNVTIAGESAGSAFCSYLTICPKAKGLFKKAICLSAGVGLYNKKEECLPNTEMLLKEFNAKTFIDLQNVPIDDLQKFWNSVEHDNICFVPYGDEYLPINPLDAYKTGASKDTIMLQGNTKDEMRLFVIGWGFKSTEPFLKYIDIILGNEYRNCDEKTMAIFKDYVKELKKLGFPKEEIPLECVNDHFLVNAVNYQIRQHAKNNGTVYSYSIHKEYAAPEFFKSGHAIDIYYLFNKFNGKIVLGTKEDIELAKDFQKMIANFCISDNPSTDKYTWEPFTMDNQKTMIINNKCELVTDYQRARYDKSMELFELDENIRKVGTLYPYWNEIKPQLIIDEVYEK